MMYCILRYIKINFAMYIQENQYYASVLWVSYGITMKQSFINLYAFKYPQIVKKWNAGKINH